MPQGRKRVKRRARSRGNGTRRKRRQRRGKNRRPGRSSPRLFYPNHAPSLTECQRSATQCRMGTRDSPRKGLGDWPKRHVRFSLPKAFFEGIRSVGRRGCLSLMHRSARDWKKTGEGETRFFRLGADRRVLSEFRRRRERTVRGGVKNRTLEWRPTPRPRSPDGDASGHDLSDRAWVWIRPWGRRRGRHPASARPAWA